MSTSNTTAASPALQAFRDKILKLFQDKDDAAALEYAEASLQNPDLTSEATCVMAAIYYRADGIGYAIKLLASLIEQSDSPNDVAEILAVLYSQAGCLSDALFHAKLATTESDARHARDYFGPDFPPFSEAFAQITSKPLLARGLSALAAGNVAAAKFALEQHLCVQPNDVEALDAYAQAQMMEGDIPGAVGMLRSVATLAGPSATLLSRMGQCLIRLGELPEGLACHYEAVARGPNAAPILGAAMADLRFVPREEALATGLPQAWSAQLASAAPKTVRPAPKYAGASPIRICYLCTGLDTPELRSMVGAIAGAHDRSRAVPIGFGRGEPDAEQNQWTRGAFDLWRDVSALDVTTMGALIRGEGVHVVVDADGLLAPAKSGLFMRNAAPVQISWLNAPNGARAPGNFLAVVPGAQAGEGELALAAGRYCLADPTGAAPVATPAPAESGSPIAFGVELTRAQLSPRLVMLWGRILQSLPGSMLLFRDNGMFEDPAVVEKLVNLFGAAGVAHRVDVIQGVSRRDFAASIDIALMPFPSADILAYGEMLRGGAPVIACANGEGPADMAAFLAEAGLADLAGADANQYAAAATALGGNVARLAELRRALPQRLASVAAFSAKGFARAIEDAAIAELGRLQSQ